MEPNAVFKCNTCGKEFAKSRALRMHLMHESMRLQKKTEQLAQSIAPAPQPIVSMPPPVIPPNYSDYKRLPPPIVAHLEKSWGNWLNYFEVKMVDWMQDFGGAGIEIKVPRAFSTEWREVMAPQYDNKTRTRTGEIKVVEEDIRTCPLKDIVEAIKWLDKVKEHVVTHAFQKGLQLPTTGLKYEGPNKTLDDYKRELAGI